MHLTLEELLSAGVITQRQYELRVAEDRMLEATHQYLHGGLKGTPEGIALMEAAANNLSKAEAAAA